MGRVGIAGVTSESFDDTDENLAARAERETSHVMRNAYCVMTSRITNHVSRPLQTRPT